jgi:branched-subunit amino acid ABC-type transport system permease component
MKKHVFSFIKQGLPISVLGPIVLAIIYYCLQVAGVTDTVAVDDVCLGIISSALLAFIAGGVTVVYEIESLPIFAAALIHGVTLYLDYLLIYLPNGWLADGPLPFVIFTGSFVLGFTVIWLIVYFSVKRKTEAINRERNEQNGK